MKKNENGFAHVVALVVVAVVTVAGTGTVVASQSSRPGDVLYNVKNTSENIRGGLVFGDVNKASYQAELAEKRFEELKSLVDENADFDRVELAEANYQESLDAALAKADVARQNGNDADDLMEILAENSLRQAAVLQEVYEKVPEQAKESILRAQQASQRGFDQSTEAIGQEKANSVRDRVRGEHPNVDRLESERGRQGFPQQAQDAQDRADQIDDNSGGDGRGDDQPEPMP